MIITVKTMLVIAALVLIVILWFKSDKKTGNKKEPPYVSIWTTLKFFKDPLEVFNDGVKKYGDIFMVNFGSFKSVFIASEENMKKFYTTPNSTLAFVEGLATMQPFLFAIQPAKLPFCMATLLKLNAPPGAAFRSWVMPRSQIERHLSSAYLEIDTELNRVCESGKPESLFYFFDRLVTLINTKLVLGENARKVHGEEIARLITILEETAATPSTVVFPYLLLWPTVARGYLARKKLLSILGKIYDSHPRNAEDESYSGELYSLYSPQVSKDGVVFGAYQMLYVAHTNTSATLSWALYHLSQNTETLEEVKKELQTADVNSFIEAQGNIELPATVRTMNETIRLQQGAIFARAVAVDDLYLDGFHIPKNTLVTTYPRYFHHNDKFFEESTKFNPNRFLDKNVEKSSFIDLFGHGTHVCLGKGLATAITKLCFMVLFSKYNVQVQLPNGKPIPDWRYVSGMPTVVSADALFTLTKKN